MMREMKFIPKGWQRKKLGEVCIVLDNLRKPINSSERQKRIAGKSHDDLFPYYGATGQVGWIDDFLTDGEFILIGEDGAPFLDFYKDKAYKIEGRAWVNNHAHILKAKEQYLINDFALYYLNSINYREFVNGTTRLKLTKSNLVEIPFVLPPLPEQKAIVAKIEELFSELENGKQQLFTAQQQLKVYRQSLLKWAFEGKLTASITKEKLRITKNEELENQDSDKGELLEGWKWVRLGDICNKIQDGSHFSPQVQYDEPGENRFKYITAKNIRNNFMDFRKVIYVDKDYHDSIYSRCNPEFGDVLLTKDGINTGEVTLNTLHEPFSLLSSVCVFKTKKDKLESSFLKYFIQSPLGNKAILESMTGTAIKRIVLRKIKDAKIILPSLSEQQIIVSELESKLTICDKIEETISQSLQQAETMRQSILKKAFEGKLVNHEIGKVN